MTGPPSSIYEFGGFRIDAARRLVSREGDTVPLAAKAFDTLLYLVEHQGVVLDKEELMKAIWPHTVVEENNLNQSISALRRMFGESPGENRYIVTVPGRGYQFVATVTKVQISQAGAELESPVPPRSSQPPDAARRSSRFFVVVAFCAMAFAVALYYIGTIRTTAVPTPQVRSLAVLPFKPLTTDVRDESLALGMTDTLIVRLSKFGEMHVRPLSSVRRFAGLEQDAWAAGRELGVESVLDGQIQRADDRIRVSARLLNVADGRQLWAKQFEDRSTDVSALQDSISRQVIAALALPLTGEAERRLTRHDTEDAEAYRHYLNGRFYWEQRTQEGLTRAVESFGAAIARDQNYALAYAGLADAYSLLGVFHVPPKDVFPSAKQAALKALMIDDRLAEAHAALGHIKVQYEYDWVGAVREYEQAIALDSGYANVHLFYALCLTQLGRFDEGLAAIRRAQGLEPSSLFVQANAGQVLYQARRFEEAVTQLTQLLDVNPSLDLAHSLLGHAYLQQGRFEEAIGELRKQTLPNPGRLADLGQAYALAGRRGEAFEELARLQALARDRYVAPYHLAVIHAGLGHTASALAALERAYVDRSTLLVWIKVDPRLDSLRAEPRFRVLLARMGLQ
jgi:DNA-binding winged helix-turn-helix (wHTH) protein/TolB-like protein